MGRSIESPIAASLRGMKRITFPLPLLLFVLLLVQAAAPWAAWSRELVYHASVAAVVDHVHDGDTVIVTVPGWPAVVSPIEVRVAGVTTGEIHDKRPEFKALAALATDWVAAHLRPGDAVTLRNVRRDTSFRLLACLDVSVDGETRDLAEELMRRGLAKPYDGQGLKPW